MTTRRSRTFRPFPRLRRSIWPGFAGIDSPLLYDPWPTALFGDAKESLAKLVAAIKAL